MLIWSQQPQTQMRRTLKCFSFSETVACSRSRSFSFFAAASARFTSLARLLSFSSLSACSHSVGHVGHRCDAVAIQMARQQLCNRTVPIGQHHVGQRQPWHTCHHYSNAVLQPAAEHCPGPCRHCRQGCMPPSHYATRRKLGLQLPALHGAPKTPTNAEPIAPQTNAPKASMVQCTTECAPAAPRGHRCAFSASSPRARAAPPA